MVEFTKKPIYKVQVFECDKDGRKTKSRITNVYGVVGEKWPKLSEVNDFAKEPLTKIKSIAIKG